MMKNKPHDFQAQYFACQFDSWKKLVESYRFGGDYIPSRQIFLNAQKKIKKIRH